MLISAGVVDIMVCQCAVWARSMMPLHLVELTRVDGKLYCRVLALKNIKMTEVRHVTLAQERQCVMDRFYQRRLYEEVAHVV